MPTEPRALELLAPARDRDTAIAAIRHGADAVYIGGPTFGARSAAGNSIEDIRRVVEYAHPFGVKVYVAVNTIIYEDELDELRPLVEQLDAAGVDALIVQDMAFAAMTDLPAIDLHASTQCDNRTPERINMLSKAGFSQIVLPREFSIDEIREAARAADGSKLEAFVHGALCVSYSGDCHAGWVSQGRSANRGECPQICRLKYTLTDSQGRPVRLPDGSSPTRHWLSLADMRRIDSLGEMADAGVSSFKIEGRLKSPDYVKEVTAAYSEALDRLVAARPQEYCRASWGRSQRTFTPDVERCFNRGFTPYFLHASDARGISSINSPKWTGRPVGRIARITPTCLTLDSATDLHAGDGLGWFDQAGEFKGFRVNRVDEWGRIFPAPGSTLPSKAGVMLYRNRDAHRDAMMSRDDTAERTIDISAVLRLGDDRRAILELKDSRGYSATVASQSPYTDTARTPQLAARKGILERLGDTIYRLADVADNCGDTFIPAKELTALRRRAVDTLDRVASIGYRRQRRKAGALPSDALSGRVVTYHDNVANSIAHDFYTSHGARVDEMALEVADRPGELRVMTTRYCIRRELDACLLDKSKSKRLPQGDLRLEAPLGSLRLHCDCANCQMLVSIKR